MKIYTHTVQYYETDKMGITHHSNYVRWMEEARVSFLKESGCSFSDMESRGITSPVVSISCRYRNPSYFEDVIYIHTMTESITGVKLRIKYIMKDAAGITVCEGCSEHAFFRDGKPLHIEKDMPMFYSALINELA